jgi:hypothetical protein
MMQGCLERNGGGLAVALRRTISRQSCLCDVQTELARGLGVSVTFPLSRPAQTLLDVLTIALAAWYGSICRADVQHGRLGDIVEQLWSAAEILLGRVPVRTRQRVVAAQERAFCAQAELWLLLNHEGLFRRIARVCMGVVPNRAAALAQALSLPPPPGAAWQTSESPVAMLRDRAWRIEAEQRRGGDIPRTDAMYCGAVGGSRRRTDALGLTTIAENAGEAILEPCVTAESVEKLKQAVADDEKLYRYIECRLRLRARPEETWLALGWTRAHGKRVDRRFRRLRTAVKDLAELREESFAPATRGIGNLNTPISGGDGSV